MLRGTARENRAELKAQFVHLSQEELASAMEDCLSRAPEELQRMGELGHRRVIARHSIDEQGAKLAELFRASGCAP